MSLREELVKTKDQVEHLLATYAQSRNNDFYLQLLWLKHFGGLANLPYIEWGQIKRVAGKLENVSRIRRKIQHDEGKYPPTDPDVAIRRKLRAEEYRQSIVQV
jgi:hypothetical protein